MARPRFLLLLQVSLLLFSVCQARLDDDGGCALLTLVPFTDDSVRGEPRLLKRPEGGDKADRPPARESNQDRPTLKRWPTNVVQEFGYSHVAATQMAIDHFNARDPVIVPELANLTDCSVYFPEQTVADSGFEESKALRAILEANQRRLIKQMQQQQQAAPLRSPQQFVGSNGANMSLVNTNVDSSCQSLTDTVEASSVPHWCAVLGPKGEKPTIGSAALTIALNIPNLFYSQTTKLATRFESGTTLAVATTKAAFVDAVLSYLSSPPLDRKQLAVLHSPPAELAEAFRPAGKLWDINIVTRQHGGMKLDLDSGEDLQQASVRFLKMTGIKTILLALESPKDLLDLAVALQQENMLGSSDNAVTNEYLYLLSEESVSLDRVNAIVGPQIPGSPLDNLLNGALVISMTDHVITDSSSTPFTKVWNMQNASFVEQVNQLIPENPKTGAPIFQAASSFFQDTKPAVLSSYIYDSVMAVGLGACNYQKQLFAMPGYVNSLPQTAANNAPLASPQATTRPPPGQGLPPGQGPPSGQGPPLGGQDNPPNRRLQAEPSMVNMTTTASSNLVNETNMQPEEVDLIEIEATEDEVEDYKAPELTPAVNVTDVSPEGASEVESEMPGDFKPQPQEGELPDLSSSIAGVEFNGASGRISFTASRRVSSGATFGAFNIMPSDEVDMSGWRNFSSTLSSFKGISSGGEWVSKQPFMYRDGSTDAPKGLRQIEDNNYLSQWVHIVGLTLFAIALSMSLGSMFLVWYLRRDRIMMAGQPPFLYVLCLGAALMSISIFTLSWDEGFGWNDQQLDIACALTPWFFFVGHLLMFTSLFTKIWRVDKVLQFSRQRVKVVQVLGPLLILLFSAIAILSVWTVVDPWTWERILIQESPAETYGECTSANFDAWFLCLTGLIVLAKLTTAVMAWKTADIPQDLSDTSSVFYAISTHLQAWFIGLPILAVLGNDSPDATYFGRVLLIWIFSVSGVALVVVSKIVKAIQVRRNPGSVNNDRVHISGLITPVVRIGSSDPLRSQSTEGSSRLMSVTNIVPPKQ